MMDRTALLRRAEDLHRAIFASLPWGVRFAKVFRQLLADSHEHYLNGWGQLIGAAMLQAGVQGMPDPGPKWDPKIGDMRRLPAGYMAHFMAEVWGTVKRRYKDPTLVEEAIQDVLHRISQGKLIIKPLSLASAESWLKTAFLWAAKDISEVRLRQQGEAAGVREESMENHLEGQEGITRDIEDPSAFKHVQRNMSHRLWTAWMDYLARTIDVDIPQYIALVMEGYDQDEIIGMPRAGLNEDGTPKKPGMLEHYKPSKSDPQNYAQNKVNLIAPKSRGWLKQHDLELSDLLV